MPARRKRSRAKPIRTQPRDPVTGKRASIYAQTLAERDARLLRIGQVRRDLLYGGDPAEARKAARPALGRTLTTDEVWKRYVATKPDRPRRKADGYWRSYIAPYLGGRRAWDLSPDVLGAWIVDLGKSRGRTGHGLAPATIWICYDLLAAAFNRLVPRELPGLPWGSWRPGLPRGKDAAQTRREWATNIDELRALVLAAREHDERNWRGGRFGDMTNRVVVLLLTGMRQAEACGLGWDMVAIDPGATPLMHIWYQAPSGWPADWPGHTRPPAIPKGRRRRKQIMHPNVVDALRAQREALQAAGWHRPDGPCFPGTLGDWRTSGRLIRPEKMRALAIAAGLPNPHLWVTHSTRHTFASLEIHASLGDFRATKERTGHASIAQLEGYYHSARGLPESKIPRLSAETVQPAIETEGQDAFQPIPAIPAVAGNGGNGDAAALPVPAAQQKPAALPPAPVPPRPRAPQQQSLSLPRDPKPAAPIALNYIDAARQWVSELAAGRVPLGVNGRALVRPPCITEDIQAHQRRIRGRYKGKLGARELAAKVAAARKAKLAAWARAVNLAAKQAKSGKK